MSSWPSSTHFCAKSGQTRTREILGVLFFVACRMYFFIDREMVIPWRSVCIIFLRSTVPEIQFGCVHMRLVTKQPNLRLHHKY